MKLSEIFNTIDMCPVKSKRHSKETVGIPKKTVWPWGPYAFFFSPQHIATHDQLGRLTDTLSRFN